MYILFKIKVIRYNKNVYMKLTALCKSEPAVASFPKGFPLLLPKIFVKTVSGKARVYRLLIEPIAVVDVTRIKFFKHIDSVNFDNTGDRTIASVIH